MPKVSVIITAHNYGKYLPKAIDSVLGQSFDDFEIIIVNDGSTDDTSDVLATYVNCSQINLLTLPGVGLATASNRGIQASRGEYIVRLDADDHFDENLLLVESTYLDKNPNVGLVFCDYYLMDVHGEITERVRRGRVNDEIELLDRPALAAGAMYRRKCFDAIGGYNESLRYQEDYDFWIKFIEKFQVRNVNLPLMYYRQHGRSMSRNWMGRMQARRVVKAKFVSQNRERYDRKILAVVPARADKVDERKLPLLRIGDDDLLLRCIKKLNSLHMIDRVVVSTDDPEIAEKGITYGAEVPYLRTRATENMVAPFEKVLEELLRFLSSEEDFQPDIVILLHPHSPFIAADHVAEAIDTLLLFNADSVVAVLEDLSYHWTPGRYGLTPVGYQRRVVRQDKDLVYKEAGGLYVFKTTNLLNNGDLFGKRISHIELAPWEAVRVRQFWDEWVANQVVENGNQWFEN